MRRKMAAGNWKMNGLSAQLAELDSLGADHGSTSCDIVICPPATLIVPAVARTQDSPVSIGGQDCHTEIKGAHTGDISAPMLADAGASHVITGHSERRQYFHETDDTVNKRIVAAIKHDLVPVFCVGETETEREANITFSVLDKQVTTGLQDIALEDLSKLVVAYEPIWAIGTGKTATTEQAQEVHQFIRSLLEKAHGSGFAESIRIVYGGSVKPDNVAELMSMPDVDGGLVGGASLDAVSFSKIVLY